MQLKDLTGLTFGKLKVIRRDENLNNHPAYLCQCECGNMLVVRGQALISGNTKSCGCLRKINYVKKHSRKGTRLYRIWKKMKSRCSNLNDPDYQQYYGSRGITVCDEWLHNFQAFHDWAMSHGYSDELTIDRMDNDKGYSPDNCRWATAEEQRHNQRKVIK